MMGKWLDEYALEVYFIVWMLWAMLFIVQELIK